MTILHLKGRITEDGRLEVELPPELPAGEVDVTVNLAVHPLTPEEIHSMMQSQPMTGRLSKCYRIQMLVGCTRNYRWRRMGTGTTEKTGHRVKMQKTATHQGFVLSELYWIAHRLELEAKAIRNLLQDSD